MSKTLLLLANGFEMYEASVFTDVLGWNQTDGAGTTELISAGQHPQLQPTFGMTVTPDYQLDKLDLDQFDACAIPGGFEEAGFYDDAFAPEFLDVIRHFDRLHKPIASICVAALPVAKSGVLHGRNATTYRYPGNPRQDQLAQLGANVQRTQRLVQDHNIVTSSSPETALDVAFWLLNQLTDVANTRRVKQAMGWR